MQPIELRLQVKEAKYHDVGRGIGRISKKNMKKLGVLSGDVLEIKGSNDKKTTVIVWPIYSIDENKDIISIDATTRMNAGVHLDELVVVQKIEVIQAEKIVLAPTTEYILGDAKKFFHMGLQGRAVSIHDTIRLEYMGQRIEYKVVNLFPKNDSVVIDENTVVEALTIASPSDETMVEMKLIPRISYEDIGGMDETIQRVREMVELPMRYPELFERLGVEPPKGVLLYGPPGTGKTLLAKAVASETDSHFINVSGPEIMSKFYGESEQNIREIFDEAKEKAPSIIFIDEIDSIATKRDDTNSGEVERRIVSQMLALMDGLESRGEIIVIGATNRPNAIDPALRRPGRFDREIEIEVPNQKGRLVILEIHTRSMPLAEGVDLKSIAMRTHGFVGADLASLTKEAAMRAIRRVFPKIVWGEEIPSEIIDQISVTSTDFDVAITDVKPSALREVIIDVPAVSWDEVGGLDEIKQELKEIIEWPSKYPSVFNYMDAEIPRGVLLIGPPGTGKTLLVRALASETSFNFIYVKGSEVHSKWVGESEKAIQETFRKARMGSPCIVFFDEIDTLVPSRKGYVSDAGVTDRIITTFLTELDGLEELNDVIVIAASNRPDVIDSALLRPGRFERIIELPMPDEKTREEILKVHTRDKPLSPKISLSDVVKKTNGFSGADIKGLINRATFYAINRFLQEHQVKLNNTDPTKIDELINDLKPEIKLSDMVESLNYFQTSSKKDPHSKISYKM
ncbi:MAG: CDC48 family AAA ATPase [Candidatus Hodarchaeota archaeon]